MENWIEQFELKKNEEFVIFIEEWLKEDSLLRSELYTDTFLRFAWEELEMSKGCILANCQLNCYINPYECLEIFYSNVNNHLPDIEQFDFKKNIPLEYYNKYDDPTITSYFGSMYNDLSLDDHVYFGLTIRNLKEYYSDIDSQFNLFRGKVNCLRALKIKILQDSIFIREKALRFISSDLFGNLYLNSEDYIRLEMNAIKIKIKKIESNAMELPLTFYENECLDALENWISNMQDTDTRYHVELFCLRAKVFIDQAFKRDMWERLLLCTLGVENSKIYLESKEYNKKLPFSPEIIYELYNTENS